jgi:hypothetical protein
LTRYSIAGGMPRYLESFADRDLARTIVDVAVDPHGQLYNEPRAILQAELREPTVYFSILAELAHNPQDASSIGSALRMQTRELSAYLVTLESLRLAARRRPVGAPANSRTTQWRCTDHFMRFWFRFIQPFQGELEAGAPPLAHVQHNVVPNLNDHSSPVFEDAVAGWIRSRHAGATAVGPWWGPALNRLRAARERSTEEIDAVALRGQRVAAVAEAKWTNKPLAARVLSDLLDYKLPALAQAGFTVGAAEIVLASRSGFTKGLRDLAAVAPNTTLIDATDLLDEVVSGKK